VAEIASEAQAEVEKQNDIARRYYNLLAKEQKKAIDYEALFKQEVAWGEEKLREVERLQVIESGFRAAYEPSQGEDDWYNRRLPLIRAAQDALKEEA
jgi:hypothetical protein